MILKRTPVLPEPAMRWRVDRVLRHRSATIAAPPEPGAALWNCRTGNREHRGRQRAGGIDRNGPLPGRLRRPRCPNFEEPPRLVCRRSDVRFEIAFTPLQARLRGLSPHEAAPEAGRKAIGLLEMSRHMALVSETGFRRCIGEAGSRPDQPADGVQPPHDEVTVGTCAEDRPELARQRKPIEACNRFEIAGAHRAGAAFIEEAADAPDKVPT